MGDKTIVRDALNAATFPDDHASGSHMRVTALRALQRLADPDETEKAAPRYASRLGPGDMPPLTRSVPPKIG